ncbi:MAG TPA: CDP-alcohol phosphatidyltransferase family protein [Xanthobacteraceae bacterium]|nr:CDP-alcohol phosphatidyltransferase family protein [Xanthobacteraceae bacterium]
MNLPNLITIGRILAVPMIVWAITAGEEALAFWLFLAAGLSDAVDGMIARRFDMRSELGAYLDPLADKALLMSIYVTLAAAGSMPRWVAIAVVSRDIMIVGAVVLSRLLDKPVTIRPLLVSKLNTAAQIAFAALVLAALGFGIELGFTFNLGLLAVGTLTVVSAAAYLAEWTRHMAS